MNRGLRMGAWRRNGAAWAAAVRLAAAFGLLSACAAGCVREGAVWYFEPPELRQAQREIHRALTRIDDAVEAAATTIAETGGAGAEAQEALDYLVSVHPAIASAHVTDGAGGVLAIAPRTYQATVGAGLGDAPDLRQVLREGRPVLSPVSRSPHGPYAVALRRPVPGAGEGVAGSVGVLLRYAALLELILQPIYGTSPFDAFVLQLDGLVLFDRDPNERGRNVFEDDFYRTFPEFVALAREIVANPEGRGTARFLTTGHHSIRPQSFVWTTVSLHDTAWRVVLSRD